MKTPSPRFTSILTIFYAFLSLSAVAQHEKHPGAEKAMAKIVLKKDFGDQIKFDSREVITLAKNDGVPGLNGLMFMKWKGANPASKIMASVQWFEKKEDLLKFYSATIKSEHFKQSNFNKTRLWKIGENGYSWTDGEHFMVTLGGSPAPPEEMVKAWLKMIGSKVSELEKQAKKDKVPAEPQKE